MFKNKVNKLLFVIMLMIMLVPFRVDASSTVFECYYENPVGDEKVKIEYADELIVSPEGFKHQVINDLIDANFFDDVFGFSINKNNPTCPKGLSISEAYSYESDTTKYRLMSGTKSGPDAINLKFINMKKFENVGDKCDVGLVKVKASQGSKINEINSAILRIESMLNDGMTEKTAIKIKNEYATVKSLITEFLKSRIDHKRDYSNCENVILYLDQTKENWLNPTEAKLNDLDVKITNFLKDNKNNLTGEANDILKGVSSSIKESVKFSGFGATEDVNCETFKDAMIIVNDLFKMIQIVVPILLILMGALDFSKVVFSNDQDAMKKAVSTFTKRCMAAIAIFFLPLIINLIFNMPGIKDEIERPFCEIQIK